MRNNNFMCILVGKVRVIPADKSIDFCRGTYYILRLRAHGVVSERFHSELFQKAPDLLTQFNKNQHKPRLRTKT